MTEKELKKLELDAKRYRFIRQFGDPNFDCLMPQEPKSPEHLDALIDAAIIGENFKG